MTKPAVPAIVSRHIPSHKAERALQFDRAAMDEEKRTVTIAFASEMPVDRGWGVEILDMGPKSMRQGRLRSGANLLVDHNWTDVVGVIESVSVGEDRVARAQVRFGRSARADEVWTDVRDGIRQNVSVGYLIHRADLVEKRDGQETYRVMDWEPFEISLVSVPADPTVGVGRALDLSAQPQAALQDPAADTATPSAPASAPVTQEVRTMEPNVIAAPAQPAQPAAPAAEQRNHAAEITRIAATMPGGAELAMAAIQRGLTVEQFQREAIEKLATRPVPTADVGMSQREVRRYSIMRAINALANPSDAAAQRAAAFERECSDAVGQRLGKQAQGFFLPLDVQRRDITAASGGTDGGNLVATNLLGGDFINALRNAMVLPGLGARMLTGLVGNIAIPKQASTSSAYWVAENVAPTESTQTFGQVTMSPKTVGTFTDISRRLMLQSSIDVEAWVQQELAMTLGLAIQQAAINGTGQNNQPSGIITRVGNATVVGGTDGAAPTWANIVELESDVAVANADIGSLAYLTNAKVRGKLKTTSKVSGQNGFVWDGGDTPLNGYRAAVTNAVPGNLTKGNSSGVCSAIIFGNFADLMIGMWGTLDLLVDPYTGSAAGTVRVRALQDVDVAVRFTESFSTMLDALTT